MSPGPRLLPMDGNEAAARVAYALSELIALYPITPSSPMGELSDAWAAAGKTNLWGAVPRIVEMQSEGGAAGTLHGGLCAGALATTFTSSQGLLLMLPNMYKLAGELAPAVIHCAARSLATSALSIFGDHSDVMAARGTGFALLASASVQEAHDLALVAHAAALGTRLPFLHFFDGFRTSHEIQKIALLEDADLRALVDAQAVRAVRARALDPEKPTLRGTAQNPDTFFQAREAVNGAYRALPGAVSAALDRLAARTGRAYGLFDYAGAPDAERVLVLMGSGCGAAEEAVEALCARGEKVGLLKVRLYRPFAAERFVAALPASARAVAVLDRSKEPGAGGEPLYLDCAAALAEDAGARFGGRPPVAVGGRYGLSSKEFTPAMAAAALAELAKPRPKRGFTVGITDDLGGSSLMHDTSFTTERPETYRAVFYGLGSDGTVSANKNTIKIIAERTPLHAQGYFVYDSKKAGSTTVSHLRFGPHPIRSTYLIEQAQFVACHQESLLDRLDPLERAADGVVFLLNSATPPARLWESLPVELRESLLAKRARVFVVDAGRVAREAGLGGRINTVMQTCFFALARIIPEPADAIKKAIEKSYAKAGPQALRRNFAAVDAALSALVELPLPERAGAGRARRPPVPAEAPPFVRAVTAELLAGRGDALPVSALPPDGIWPTGTARWEKRNLAVELPVWDERSCIQCNKCALVCPHAAIRVKAYPGEALAAAPAGFKSMAWRGREFPDGTRYTVQLAPEDCTGCGLCVEACPAKAKGDGERKALFMRPQAPLLDGERAGWSFFLDLPEARAAEAQVPTVKSSQLARPLFEFSGACAGCGETPYLKLLTQLFGDRLAVANATGCSSIYGGNLPTTPWTARADGRGPAWANSLFEDNAEFGLGFRLAYDEKRAHARALLACLDGSLDPALLRGLLSAEQRTSAQIEAQRERVAELKRALVPVPGPDAADLLALADDLVRKSVWIVGGDGWAYDIGYGGLDHVLASGADVNLLVLDTEVYSNTGGQASKATPRAAVAKFASGGKRGARKDLAQLALTYGSVYVAQVAFGAKDAQTVRAFVEAESYPGPSLIIAYAHCIAHGYELREGLAQQRRAVDCGYWPLFRRDPRRAEQGKPALQLDARPTGLPFTEYALREGRYQALASASPRDAEALLARAREDAEERLRRLERAAEASGPPAASGERPAPARTAPPGAPAPDKPA